MKNSLLTSTLAKILAPIVIGSSSIATYEYVKTNHPETINKIKQTLHLQEQNASSSTNLKNQNQVQQKEQQDNSGNGQSQGQQQGQGQQQSQGQQQGQGQGQGQQNQQTYETQTQAQQAYENEYENTQGEEIQDDISGDYTALFSLNYGPMMCTLHFSDGIETIDGIVYSDGINKVNIKATVSQSGASITGYMIDDSSYIYVWPSVGKSGVKVPTSLARQYEEPWVNELPYGTATLYEDVLGTSYSYNCKKWQVDNSKFIPPSNISFIDAQTLVEQADELIDKADELEKTAIDKCNQLPPRARQRCLSELQN